jgi:hypothetical protein
MTIALYLLAAQGAIGAFDTLYYHEWKARLPARPSAAPELKLHALRDFLYAALFGTLPWLAWRGWWLAPLVVIVVAEIVLTLADFVIEMDARKPLGDVYAGERVTHAVMGILYGAMIANLLPTLRAWWNLPAALAIAPPPIPAWLRLLLVLMTVGVAASGIRDFCAAWQWSLVGKRTAISRTP